ncbi:bifunctional aconitate hydratase 2/2-methylisocitrate dehydratase [Vibrio sp. JC009]|uniref:bifunctional aconitate hydratase 2/2-methylisocitrate dehydratase n=1 Tax=Vibrio sp. JC009 TaxID=2912314 RepID=UPI0023AF16D3|nr:bifunctional aconitate hydratase 2/2-methylisocitrate dehydratase [Vibrio sp. JC009]WED23900.1 bifunctional aconitate hydratase 2/2-methylisocitrate dehydratase [Vibrio sp. JC009]
MKSIYQQYLKKCEERAAQGVAKPSLTAEEVTAFFALLENESDQSVIDAVVELLTYQTPAGVDDAAKVKADKLFDIAQNTLSVNGITPLDATKMLGSMVGGYCVDKLIALLDDAVLGWVAADELKSMILVYEKADEVVEKSKENINAKKVVDSWASEEWFAGSDPVAERLTMTVFKVTGESTTDDFSPAPDAWSRPDIPLHARSMYKNPRDGVHPDEEGVTGPVKQIDELKAKGLPICFVGDVVGTGSSRKSAANSLIWYIGQDIPFVPNKRAGGVVLGGKIAPIFFNTLEDSGALAIEVDVSLLETGDVIDIYPYEGVIRRNGSDEALAAFSLKHDSILDQVRAGGRIPYLIGKSLTKRVRAALNMPEQESNQEVAEGPFTLAQKMVGKACGVEGIKPGTFCTPKVTTVGSQDTTGGMTRDEIKDLACTKFSADLVMQSFCHTSAYPRVIDSKLHATLPGFFHTRGGIALRPGDGVIHSWLNRMLVPDTLGTGGDSHTRFPVGISFPAGSGLVAYAATTGTMPIDMPESVLVKFSGEMQPGITLRDLVHAIPYFAKQQGLLTLEKANKVNVFSGRILEIQGLEHLTTDEAFELTDATAERSAAATTVALSEEKVIENMQSNVTLLNWMIENGYGDRNALQNRVDAIQTWLSNPELLKADEDAEYAAVIEIDLNEIKEPILCCPNDPDDARLLSEVTGTEIDEVFVGSCMTHVGHFRATAKLLADQNQIAKSKLWLAPPTKMDDTKLRQEGCFNTYVRFGARVEEPGCSLCMGNQARAAEGTTVVSTSTRNFPNRVGTNTQVFLASAELATIAAIAGKLPTAEEYQSAVAVLEEGKERIYNFLAFDKDPIYNKELNLLAG